MTKPGLYSNQPIKQIFLKNEDHEYVVYAMVKHGRWVFRKTGVDTYALCCSNCDARRDTSLDFAYCPHCGAKMDLKEDNDG